MVNFPGLNGQRVKYSVISELQNWGYLMEIVVTGRYNFYQNGVKERGE